MQSSGMRQLALDAKEGENPLVVPVRFKKLVDPTRAFLLTEGELAAIRPHETVWDRQASGMPVSADLARAIDELIEKQETGK